MLCGTTGTVGHRQFEKVIDRNDAPEAVTMDKSGADSVGLRGPSTLSPNRPSPFGRSSI